MQNLLPPELLARLEQLQFASVKRSKSAARGERSSKARGQSVEFADYRNYVAGDDFRRIDWNLYSRLDRLYLRLYEEERELPISIFLDASESMKFGAPSKFETGRRIAAACAYVGLAGFDRVSIVPFPPKAGGGLAMKNVRGKKSARLLFTRLTELLPQGDADFNAAMRRQAVEARVPGVAFVISDFLDLNGCHEGLKSLQGRGFRVHAVHILAPEELNPQVSGDLKLIDAETGLEQEVTFGKYRLKKYQQTVEKYRRQISEFCQRNSISYIFLRSDTPVETVLLKDFRKFGVWN